MNMNDFFNTVIGLAVIAFVAWQLIKWRRVNSWSGVKARTLSLKSYRETHPECSTNKGMRCAACGSSSIKNWGFEGATDHRRIFICNHCNTRLYWTDGT